MTDEEEPRPYLNRWGGDTSDPAPTRNGSYRVDACSCFDQSKPHPRARVGFHTERQDTSAPGWQHLLELVDEAAADGREEFRPLIELSPEERRQVITLPPSIARLTAVRHLVLYGSNLVRIPTEIGAMTGLEEFTPYTSYRLHWFPYEITRCRKLTRSTVSTRALFGNYKLRVPFPRLQPPRTPSRISIRKTWIPGAGAPPPCTAAACATTRSNRADSIRCGTHYAWPRTSYLCWSAPAHRRVSPRCRAVRVTTSLHRTRADESTSRRLTGTDQPKNLPAPRSPEKRGHVDAALVSSQVDRVQEGSRGARFRPPRRPRFRPRGPGSADDGVRVASRPLRRLPCARPPAAPFR